MLPIPLTYAVSKPWTVMVIGTYTLLAHPAVPSSERHVNKALGAVSQAYLDLACAVAPLDCG